MRILSPLLLAATLSLAPLTALAEAATLTVTGSATVETVPDLATLSLGVTTNGATAAAAMSANSDALASVIARLKAAGVADRDIQTSNLSLNPNWVTNSMGTASEIQGYVATNMLTITTLEPVCARRSRNSHIWLTAVTVGPNTSITCCSKPSAIARRRSTSGIATIKAM